MRVMPSPPVPEANFGEEGAGGWDLSVGYGRIWDSNVPGSLDGIAAGVVWRGSIGSRFGITLSPLFGGYYGGTLAGYSASSSSLGAGFSFGSRLLGHADSSNLIVFGGGLYSWGFDRETNAFGTGEAGAHFFGFSLGVKSQIQIAKFVRIIPFYVYMGGSGAYTLRVDTALPLPQEDSGSLGYRDHHLLGLDFNVYGLTAKLIADLFRDDYKSFTVMIDILGTIRGVRSVVERHQ